MDLDSIVFDIKNGEVVILPTDTLHALSCAATINKAVQSLMQIKGRKENHPLPILVKDLNQAKQYGYFNPIAEELAEKHWGGALTIVVPIRKNTDLSPTIYGNFETIALRVPKGELITNLLNNLDCPLVGTSANLSGKDNLLTEKSLNETFGNKVKQIIFSKDMLSTPSTIVDCTTDEIKIIRQGAVEI